MKNASYEDHNNIERFVDKSVDEKLIEIKGTAFKDYRQKFNDARLNKVRTELPLQLSIESVSYCNLMCKMCYRNYTNNKTREQMPLELADNIANQARELKIPSIWMGTHTEFLLHPEIKTILNIFGSIESLDFWLTTNGTYLTSDVSEILCDIGLTKLCVSIDAASPETYKAIRGGNYNNLLKNIDRFLEIREKKNLKFPFLRVTFVEQDENKHEKQLFVEKWKNIADIVDIQKLMDFSILYDENKEKNHPNINFECTDPFYHLIIKYDGEYLACCNPSYQPIEKSFFQNIGIKKYWQSKNTIDFANSLYKNNFPKECRQCVALLKTF